MGWIQKRARINERGFCSRRADVAQLVEHSLGKGEVTGSIPVISSRLSRFGFVSGHRLSRAATAGGNRGFAPEESGARSISSGVVWTCFVSGHDLVGPYRNRNPGL